MRRVVAVAIFVAVLLSVGFAKDKKAYLYGRLVDLRTQELSASAVAKSPSMTESLSTVTLSGGKRPTTTRYSLIVSSDAEMLYLSCDRESTTAQPVLKNDMDLKWRDAGEDWIEIVDGKGKKFNFEVLRRVAKDAPTLKPNQHPETVPQAK